MYNNTTLSTNKYLLKAGCKVNLSLKITNILKNGLHELDSLFIPIGEPYDELTLIVEPKKQGLIIFCDTLGIDPQNNTLTKAYKYYAETTGFSPDISLFLKKGIPHGSGLGGGSSDAAIFLLWLQKHAPQPLSKEQLSKLACKVGADTPFFLRNIPCRVTGIGEKITPVPLSDLPIVGNTLVLILPNIHINTSWSYKNWDTWFFNKKPPLYTQSILTKNQSQDRSSTISFYKNTFLLENDFEPSIFNEYPILRQYKEQLIFSGARAAALSGSGSSLWALFTEKTTALNALKDFQEKNIQTSYHIL